MIFPVERDRIPELWREAAPFIQMALDHAQGEFDSYDILRFLLSKDMLLWAIYDDGLKGVKGVAVTQWINYPRLSAVRIVLLAGNGALESWFKEAMEAIEAWARQVGAKRIEETGRAGWERLEKKLNLGFRKTYITMAKDL